MEDVKITGADLQEIMIRHLEEVDEEAAKDRGIWDLLKEGRVTIQTADEANAVAKAIVQAEADVDRIGDIMNARLRRAQGKVERLKRVFWEALRGWTQSTLQGKKKRSLILDDAMLQLRQYGAKIVTENGEALTEFVERYLPEALTYAPVVSVDKVKEWEATNEKLAPGRHEEPSEERLYLKIPKKEEE